MRAARRRGCASKAQDMVSPAGKARRGFWPPYAGGHSDAWEVSASDHTGFSKVSHFAGQNGTLIRRPRWRARACEMGGAGGARPRTFFVRLGTLCLSRRYWGLRPLAPYLPVSGASVSEAFRGRRWAKPFDDGMTTCDTQKPVKDSHRLRPAPKRFSLWSLRGFFLTRQKEISQKQGRRGFRPCIPLPAGGPQAIASKRSLVRARGFRDRGPRR